MKKKQQPLTVRERLQQQYRSARGNLLLMLIFTLVNIVLLVAGSDTMFLFSATVPYLAISFGIIGEQPIFLGICVCIAVVALVLYGLCWLLSKNNRGWMIFALVLFIIDTLALLGFYMLAEDFSGILDIAIHAWVLYYLVVGIIADKKLRDLPLEEVDPVDDGMMEQTVNTNAPRLAEDTKARILAEGDAVGHHVVYRRVKRTNELVIDGYVYDSVEMLVETAHTLSAVIDGNTIEVGFDGVSSSFIQVNGERIVKKLRLW